MGSDCLHAFRERALRHKIFSLSENFTHIGFLHLGSIIKEFMFGILVYLSISEITNSLYQDQNLNLLPLENVASMFKLN